MHPAQLLVKTLIDKKLPPGHGPVGVQPFLAHYVHLGPEIKRHMRIDVQNAFARLGDFG